MRAKAGKQSLALALVTGLLVSSPTHAHHTAGHDQNPSPPASMSSIDTYSFEAGSIIIPLDSCYQRPTFMNDTELTTIIRDTYDDAAATTGGKVCNTAAQMDDGVIPAYSLVQRLVRDGIIVSWALKGGKTSWHDWDFKITKAGGGPVQHMTRTGTLSNRYSSLVEIRYAGAPFIIDSSQADEAKALMASYSNSYSIVDFHVAQVAFDAPVYGALNGLPKLAILNVSDGTTDLQNQQTGKLQGSVTEAIMDDMAGTWFQWVTIPEVNAGKLINENFELVWVPSFELKTGQAPTAAQMTFLNNLAAFADQGGHVLYQDGAIAANEGWGDWSGAAYDEKHVPTTGYQSDGGIIANGVTSSWDNGNDDERTLGQDYSDPASQFGGMFWTGIGGSKYNWKPRYDRAYREGVRRMIYTDHATDSTKDNWDIASWRYKDNDTAKGVIYYLGGDNWRKVTAAGFRVLLNTIFVHTTKSTGGFEVSRASPIVATISNQTAVVQGTYEKTIPAKATKQYTSSADASTFRFPSILGHMRAVPAAEYATGGKDFEDMSEIFDAADGIPAPNYAGCGTSFTAGCRTVFTTTIAGLNTSRNSASRGRVVFDQSNAATLGAVMASDLPPADQEILIQRVLAGYESAPNTFVPKLGGVDRSTVAVIPQSTVAGTTRPTMVYFGATDGMVHAVCASIQGACTSLGQELWAYVPRTALPELRYNSARIDGSPRVMDLFGDFYGTGRSSYRTILMFQTGDGDATISGRAPGVYALDVTNPADPVVLWDYTTPALRGTHEIGVGHIVNAGRVNVAGATKLYAFAQSNNGGVAGAGSVTTAIDITTGAKVWSHDYTYPAPRAGANPSVPATGAPGGAVGVDKQVNGFITDVVLGTLYGELFLLDAETGVNRYGTNPLFRFTSDFNPVGVPPALFSEGGIQHAIVGTGSFNDLTGDSWHGNATQYAVAVSLNTPTADAPLNQGSGTPNVRFVLTFGAGERAQAQALVVGEEIFITTDSTNPNSANYGVSSTNTGKVYRVGTATGASTGATVVVRGGAGSAVANGANVMVGGASQGAAVGTALSTNGAAVDSASTAKVARKLWLRTI